jgi:hypothetical protein
LFRRAPDETIPKPFAKTAGNTALRHCNLPQPRRILEVVMTALVQAFYRASHTETETSVLKLVAMFCGACLFVSLLFATYGLDLSPGFF